VDRYASLLLDIHFCRQHIFDLPHLSLSISRPTELMEICVVHYRRFNHTTPANTNLWCRPLRTGNLMRRVGEASFNLWRTSLSRPGLPSTSTWLCCEESIYARNVVRVPPALQVSLSNSPSDIPCPGYI
jgi:hypothetical protein